MFNEVYSKTVKGFCGGLDGLAVCMEYSALAGVADGAAFADNGYFDLPGID